MRTKEGEDHRRGKRQREVRQGDEDQRERQLSAVPVHRLSRRASRRPAKRRARQTREREALVAIVGARSSRQPTKGIHSAMAMQSLLAGEDNPHEQRVENEENQARQSGVETQMHTLIPDHEPRMVPVLIADDGAFRRTEAVRPENVHVGEKEERGEQQAYDGRVAALADEFELRELFDQQVAI